MSRRINPRTGQPFASGQIRDDGKIFRRYRPDRLLIDGYYQEEWYTPDAFLKHKIRRLLSRIEGGHRRGQDFLSLEHDVTTDYLVSIFPKNMRCPVMGIKMEWGGGKTSKGTDNSPSLDRINPKLGYLKGNVMWLCNKVNRMKSDQTLETVIKLGEWAERLKRDGIESARVYNRD